MVTSDDRVVFLAANGGYSLHHVEHHTLTPFGLGLGSLLFGLGLVYGPTLFTIANLNITLTSIAGLLVIIASLLKWIWDDINDKFSIPEPRALEDWPFTGVDKVRSGVWVCLGIPHR